MTDRLQRLAIASARHRWRVIAAWILVAVGLNILHLVLPPGPASGPAVPGSSSAIAQDLAEGAFGPALTGSSPLVIHDESLDFSRPDGQKQLSAVVTAMEALGTVESATAPAPGSAAISTDGHTALISVTPTPAVSQNKALGEQMLATATSTMGDGADVAFGGVLGEALSVPDTEFSDIAGLLAAIVIMFVFFRRWAAVFVPLGNALLAVGTSLMLIGVLSRLVYIPSVGNNLAIMLGLGVGIDYALFMTTRYRSLLRQGVPREEAIGRAVSASGSAIVFAGSTLVAALLSLSLTGIHLLAALGWASAIAVALSVLASLTLVPAFFAVFGDRVSRGEVADGPTAEAQLDASFWGRFATRVTTHPWTFTVVAIVILAALAAPALRMTLGTSNPGQLPRDLTISEAYALTDRGFGPGQNGPLIVVAELFTPATDPDQQDTSLAAALAAAEQQASAGASASGASGASGGDGDPRAKDPRLVALSSYLSKVQGIDHVGSTYVGPSGGVAAIEIIPSTGPSDPETSALVERLQGITVEEIQQESKEPIAGMAVYVGGFTATTVDLYAEIAAKTPLFIGIVILLAFIVLMVAYRSLVIPLKAAVMNLISITAAYGVVTAVFVWGWGASLIGLDGPVPIDAYVPMMMFAVLFGLSMDYEVFLLTSFREHFARSGDMHVAVRRGLAETGRLVSSAALIMVVVFGSFVFADEPLLKIFGVGLSTAVIVDATVVRLMLVPAVMVLIRRGTWWLPRWLGRALPVIELEADPGSIQHAGRRRGRSLARMSPGRVLIVILSGLGAWWISVTLPGQAPSAAAAITVSVLAMVILLLAARPALSQSQQNAGSSVGVSGRLPSGRSALGFMIGSVLTVSALAISQGISAPVIADSAVLIAIAVLVVALVAVLVVSQSLWLPVMIGALVSGVGWSLVGGTEASLSQIAVGLWLPALVTALLVHVADSWLGRPGPTAPEAHAEVRDAVDAP